MKLIVVISGAVLLSAILLPHWSSSTKVDQWKNSTSYNDTDYDDLKPMVPYGNSKAPFSTAISTQQRTFPFLFNPLTLLAGLTIGGALKLGILYSVCTWVLSIFFPSVGSGLYSGFGARSFDTTNVTANLPPQVAAYVNSLSNQLTSFVPSIQQDDCKYRAVCEVSSFINNKLPAVSTYMKNLSNTFLPNLANPYARAWTTGMMQQDCSKQDFATNCPVSPFATAAQSMSRYYSSFMN